jgi:hypothetical protein
MVFTLVLASAAAIFGSAPGARAADVVIYDDGLTAGWADWSWNTAVNPAAPWPVHGGTGSLAVAYLAPWAGLYLHSQVPVDLTGHDRLAFWLHGGDAGGQRLRIVANGDGASTYAVTAQAGTWNRVEVPLTALGSPAGLTDLYWQDVTGGPQATFFLDDILLGARSGPPPPPPPPSQGPVLSIDAGADRHPISEEIYGLNFADEELATLLRLPVRRWGGNSTSRYNWRADVHNTGSDWFFENIPEDNPSPGALPDGSAADRFVEQDRRTGSRTLLTVPLIGWTPTRRTEGHPYDCGFKVSRYGAQASTDPWDPDCGDGVAARGGDITGNDPSDTSLAIGPDFVSGWLEHLTTRFGTAAAGGVAYYNLDNEPMLWNSTHRDVHPQPVSYDELRDRTWQYAAAVKAADPSARTLGPVLWGWCAYFYSALDGCGPGSDYEEHGNTPLVPWYLQQMKAYQDRYGVRLVDYLDLHHYPQAGGVALAPAGSSATQALRLRSTRSLWDATYLDESWISDTAPGGVAVALIPRMKQWVNENYPGTRLAITEYNWGALDHINGALAQADILGIFGREGLDLATLWGSPAVNQPGAFAFRIFRNYDGRGSGFGDVSVRAASADQGRLAVYAAQRSGDGALVAVIINKTATDLTSAVGLRGFRPAATAAVYRYSAAQPTAIGRLPDLAVTAGGFDTSFPANSITLLVLTPGEEAISYRLSAVSAGSGGGSLSSATPGLTCQGGSCSGSLPPGSTAVIQATAASGSSFGGWTGCTVVSGTQCSVRMEADLTVTATFAAAPVPGITLVVPNGGQTWRTGSRQTITWSFTGQPGNRVSLELLRGGLKVATIASRTALGSTGRGSYPWKVPARLAPGSDYRVRVTSTTSGRYTDTSDGPFTVAR